MPRVTKLALAAVLCLLLASTAVVSARAQSKPREPASELPADEIPAGEFTGEVAVGYVLVPVVVRTHDGYVRGLDEEDFSLFVDDQPVRFESFERRNDAPISVVFLQDLSGSMVGSKLEASREVVRYFLDSAGVADEFAIASFAGGETYVEVPFTSDLDALRQSLATWEAYGTTGLHDAVAWLPEITAGGTHAKRAAFLVTDGADNASLIGPDEARDLVRKAQVPVYVLGLGSGSPYEVDGGGLKTHRYADVLNLLALYTGGRYFPVGGTSELKEALVTVAGDLRHQYVLGFTTSGQGKPGAHRIRVEVRGTKGKVLSRLGYHGTAPAKSTGTR